MGINMKNLRQARNILSLSTSVAFLTTLTMALTLTGCSKNETGDSNASTGGPYTGTSVVSAPEGFVDNASLTSEQLEYTEDELYASVGGVAKMAVRDERVYIGGDGFQYKFAANLLSTTPGSTDTACLDDIKGSVKSIHIGGKSYSYGDIVRDKTQGLEVVKMFAKDFGVNTCDHDGKLISRDGAILDDDELRNAYSYKEETSEYTACAYYFDARMNSFDSGTYDKYREMYKTAHDGVDTGEYFDGRLGVVLYYDLEGHDYFYTIILSAPTYYSTEENFKANMDNNVRKDATNCHLETNDGIKIAFVNRTAIMCTQMPNVDTAGNSETSD